MATFRWLLGSSDGLNFYVYNPSNFNVANANTVAGLAVTSGASGNTVVSRDGSGFIYAQYFNQASPNNENPPISQIIVTERIGWLFQKCHFCCYSCCSRIVYPGNSPSALQAINDFYQADSFKPDESQSIHQRLTSVFRFFLNGCFAVSFTPRN